MLCDLQDYKDLGVMDEMLMTVLKNVGMDVHALFPEYFEAEERLKEILLSDAECFINVGRFSPEKGHDRLVDAFAAYSKIN
jgi:glycosyltransferase involved in cell wall biosynthesis